MVDALRVAVVAESAGRTKDLFRHPLTLAPRRAHSGSAVR
jgi:hypothetical protein